MGKLEEKVVVGIWSLFRDGGNGYVCSLPRNPELVKYNDPFITAPPPLPSCSKSSV